MGGNRFPRRERVRGSSHRAELARRRGLRLAITGVVAGACLALAGPAAAETLIDAYDHASGPSTPTYYHPGGESTPTYSLAQETWDTLNRDSSGLRQDAITDEERAKAAEEVSRDDGCFKAALWGIVFDAGWDLINGYSFNIGSELDASSSRALACLIHQAGLPPVTAANLTDYFMESFKNRALDVLHAAPTTNAFIDWVAVTAWYSIP